MSLPIFNPVSPLAPLAVLIVALATVKVLALCFGAPSAAGRFTGIDGLRGYLALFVFVHHSCIWYFYLRTSQWLVPPSTFFTQLGQSSVSFFFMITGFLFSEKILANRTKGIDWLKLYVSRVLRLAPLYLFAMVLLMCIVAVLTGGTLNESPGALLTNVLTWLGFAVAGMPDVNGLANTHIIVAGVPWTLAYEWLFYLSLPLLAALIGAMPSWPVLAIGIMGVLGAIVLHPELRMLSFTSGIATAVLIRYDTFRRLASTPAASVLAIATTVLAVTVFPKSYLHFALLSASFALIAGGATLFGTLGSAVSRMLGEITYSLYLLHGLVLFTLFHFVIGARHAAAFSPLEHWLIIVLTVPVLITLCFATYSLIEKPAMHSTGRVTDWLRERARVARLRLVLRLVFRQRSRVEVHKDA
ncbi:acyltransferase family protein [Paraburkholderia bannensis]|uniref:acyltransferase family protein n=1 Tax=Paraburkholderia bannensis TaxID=765414 RepID=UPI002AB622FB|nr:acyltransferase [Paraburkholderia bannensis]